jgi:hypothetical protein
MSFSNIRKAQILRTARELLAKPRPAPYVPPPPRRAERTLPRDEPFVPEYVEPARLDTTPPAPAASLDRAAIAAMIDRKVDAAIGLLHGRLMDSLKTVAECVAEQHQDSADEMADSVRALRIELGQLSATLAELRTAFANDRERRIDDLPPVSAPRRGLN